MDLQVVVVIISFMQGLADVGRSDAKGKMGLDLPRLHHPSVRNTNKKTHLQLVLYPRNSEFIRSQS